MSGFQQPLLQLPRIIIGIMPILAVPLQKSPYNLLFLTHKHTHTKYIYLYMPSSSIFQNAINILIINHLIIPYATLNYTQKLFANNIPILNLGQSLSGIIHILFIIQNLTCNIECLQQGVTDKKSLFILLSVQCLRLQNITFFSTCYPYNHLRTISLTKFLFQYFKTVEYYMCLIISFVSRFTYMKWKKQNYFKLSWSTKASYLFHESIESQLY